MKRNFILQLICSIFLFLCPLSSFAWFAQGHMVIANIAYQHLTPAARAQVDSLANYFAQEYPDIKKYLRMSYWPDLLRAQKIETFTHWHYIDMAYSNDGTPLNNTVDTDNVVWAITQIKIILKNKDVNPYERARFLAFLTHLVGDIHQPLHTTARLSAAHPTGDQGGNLFFILWNNQRSSLHYVWDSAFGEFMDGSEEKTETLTRLLMSVYPATYFGKRVNDVDPEHWASEGFVNAKSYVYNTDENKEPNANYLHTGKELAEQQAALAGYRLAALLNSLLG